MKTLILFGDVLIINVLCWIFIQYGLWNECSSPLHTHILISAIYFGIAATNSVVLHYRDVLKFQILGKVVKNVIFFTLVATPLLYLDRLLINEWKGYTLFIICMAILIFIYRMSLHWMFKIYRNVCKLTRNVVLIGSSASMAELEQELTLRVSPRYKIIGYFDDEEVNTYPKEILRLGTPKESISFMQTHNVDMCFCGLSSSRGDEILQIIQYCENNLVRFYNVPNIRDYLHNRLHVNTIGNVLCLSLHDEPLTIAMNRFMKRAFDIVFSLTFLCTLFPCILLIVTIITKITMPGPVFFCQKRNGLRGKEFYIIKFRSMVINKDADEKQATRSDPRKTKWGDIMRRTNIDELPQFINVLLGNMSIVGPRPHMIKHTEIYSSMIDKYMVRHWVKPGITGWSQVTGFRGETRNLSQMEGRIKRDIWYIEHWSFALDMYIIYKTIVNAILGEKEAY